VADCRWYRSTRRNLQQPLGAGQSGRNVAVLRVPQQILGVDDVRVLPDIADDGVARGRRTLQRPSWAHPGIGDGDTLDVPGQVLDRHVVAGGAVLDPLAPGIVLDYPVRARIVAGLTVVQDMIAGI